MVPLSARLPGSARKLPATTAQQQQQLLNSKLQESSGPGIDFPSPHRLVANNILAKPQVPQLNMGGHEGSFSSGHSPATARPAGGPGSLPHVPQHRAPNTSRPAFAAASSQAAYAGTAERAAPAAVETGPITPAQALKRYGEYLTAFEQSEVLQYQQVRGPSICGHSTARVRVRPTARSAHTHTDRQTATAHTFSAKHPHMRVAVCACCMTTGLVPGQGRRAEGQGQPPPAEDQLWV